MLRDWSKSIGEGGGRGPEQRRGGSSVLEPLMVGHSIFSYSLGVGHPVFFVFVLVFVFVFNGDW